MLGGGGLEFEADFKNLAGELYDPDAVKFTLFDYKYREVATKDGNRLSLGKFYAEMALDVGEYVYEWCATKGNNVNLLRKCLTVRFV